MINKGWRMLAALVLAVLLFLPGPVVALAESEGTQEEGVLRVGMEVNYAPFNWSQPDDANGAVPVANSKGEFANGYDVQIAKLLAAKLGLKLEIVKYEWDGLAPGVLSGKIDTIIAGMSPTAERKEQIDFTENYYTSALVLVVKKDGPYAGASKLADFSGAKVTGQLNTFHYSVIDQIHGVRRQTAMESFPSMIAAVTSGKIDAYVSEKPGALAAVAANPSLGFVEFAPNEGFQASAEDTSIAVGVKKNSPLTARLNEALAAISEEDRADIMDRMVKLNVGAEGSNGEVGGEESGSIVTDQTEGETATTVLSAPKTFWGIVERYKGAFLRGAGMTLLISIISTVVGFIIGLLVAAIRTIEVRKKSHPIKYGLHKLVSFILSVYIEIFRGTPMMVQAILIFYGTKLFWNIDMNALTAAFMIVSINTGAYLSEVVRGGIDSVDRGQLEGAKAIGMSHRQTMLYVILPQAIRNILPSIGNEFVINIKDTSVLNVIGVTELFFTSKSIAGSTYLIFESYAIVSIIYFVLTFVVTRLLRLMEKRLDGPQTYKVEERKAQ
ncbi:MAG: ABC transporter substrate-binding protein/permease [Lachnospiraceae bacterium]|nr:ABC transporter substrate-binding protein/permease [Lachnospiraceae bacterium]MDY5742162.1 ABC transporter substrate-binding protein/permease [Lachnospiraceae bacterium]